MNRKNRFKKTEKINKELLETIIWVFCIVVLFILIVRIGNQSLEYSCDKCTVKLSTKVPGSENTLSFFEYVIKDLIINLEEKNKCLVVWDPNQGYIKNG